MTPLPSSEAKSNVLPIDKPQRKKPKGLARTPMERKPSTLKRGPLGHATAAQKERVRERPCVYCGQVDVDPAHLVSRAAAPSAADDPRAVIPLCRPCHTLFDSGQIDLSTRLEPFYREEIAWAVEAVGLFTALRQITGLRWVPASTGWLG